MANGTGRRAGATWLSWVLVVVLVTIVAVLAMLAIERGRNTSTGGVTRPIPTFSIGRDSSPTPTPTLTIAAAPGPSERFLSSDSNTLWRATAGVCGATGPVIERSIDSGASWTDVTPRYRGISAVLSLGAFAGTEAQVAAFVGQSCETQALRTFTQGQFWDSYPEALATSTFVDPRQPGEVIVAGRRVAAPCAAPYGAQSMSDPTTTVLLCGGRAYVANPQNSWDDLGVVDAVAVTVGPAGLVVGHRDPNCAGLLLSTLANPSRSPLGTSCVEGADTSQPTAIASGASGTYVWTGDNVVTVG